MSDIISFGAFELDTSAHQLSRDGQALHLPPKAVDALEALIERGQKLLLREHLMDALWGDRIVGDQGLNQLIYLLRKALGRKPDGQEWIETVPKRGYRFNGPVKHVQSTALARPANGTIRVAVLPLADLPTKDQKERGLAFSDSLITRLARESSLVVRPLAAVRRLDAKNPDPLEALDALQVDRLIEGSMQASETELLVNLRLWDRTTSEVIWGDRFKASPGRLFDLEDQAGTALIKQLLGARQSSSTAITIPRRHTDPTVRNHLLRSRFLWHQWTPPAWQQAIQEARLVLDIDPDNAQARYWWAVSLIALAITGQRPPPETFHHARLLINEAIRLDPDLDIVWEGLGAIALFHDWDIAQARHLLRKAIEANPGGASARDLYALALAASGDLAGAVRETAAALDIDPLSGIVGTDLGYLHAFAGNHERAIAAYRSVLDLYPMFTHARGYLSLSLSAIGQADAALAEARRTLADSGRDPAVSHELALAWKAAGKLEQAETILDAMRAHTNSGRLDPYFTLMTAAALGHLDEAVDWLRLAIEKRSRDLCYIRVDPAFDPIRQAPGFDQELARIYPEGTGD
jgi:DNA-binding winged helix-turn-helix (wHTH) protein/Flp pilus assembly protein TadD